MSATRDPAAESQPPVLDTARLTFAFDRGTSREDAGRLVELFKRK
jgi:hypothetical protein